MDDDKIEEIPASGKKGGVLMLALGIIAGLLIGGGAVYLLFGMKSGDAPDGGTDTATEAVEAEAEAAAPEVQLLTVPIRRFAVPLIDRDRKMLGYMWVDIAFEVDGPGNQSYVTARVPELKDAFLRDLHAIQTTRADRPGALDFELLGRRLDNEARRVLGDGRLLAVRITNAVRMPD